MAPVKTPHVVSSVKLHVLKKGEYTLWSMRMDQYLTNTDYALWQVIINGDEPVQTTKDENGIETKVPPKTAQALLQRQRERKAKSILLLAIPDEYQLRFHGIKDAKTLWDAIKSRFGGNVESKKMQKNVLKQQFENFSVSDTEGLDKAYDRFQKLISLLEVHGAAFSNEDANQKFLRALPSSWNNVALIMRNKIVIDDLDIDDLYNNLKVFEADIKSSSGSSSNSQNVGFLSTEDTNSINEVNTANGVSTASGHNSQGQASSSTYTNDLMFSFFANQSNSPQLDDKDLEQIDHDDLEEIDLKWECRATRNQGNRNGDARYKSRDNTRRTVPVETSDALVIQDNDLIVQDGLGYDWIYIAQDEPTEFALMASTLGSDTEVQSCSKNSVKTYKKLQKLFDEQRQTLSKANLEIVAYQLGLESIEAQLVVHQKNEAVYEEKIAVLEFEVKNKGNPITRLTNQLEQTLKEKEDLKAKLEHDSEVINSVFDSHSSDGDDNQTNDRFKKNNEYHAVPLPLTGNYIPPLADLSFTGLDDYIYRHTANKTSASMSQVEISNTSPSSTSVEMPRVESVRPSGVIIEDWVSDDDEDIFQSNDVQTTVKPSFKKIEFTKARNEPVKSDKQVVKPSYSHLIKDCDFHEKRMSKKSVLNDKGKGTGHREVRPIWNNTQRINHQNKFVPTAVLTRSGRIPGNQQQALKYKGIFDSGCSRHMTGNKLALLTDYQDIDGGFVAFGGSTKGGKITEVENQLNHKVKVIRTDNGTEFKNREIDEFCRQKGIKREYSVARTAQQNGVAKDDTVDDDACKNTVQEPANEYDQSLKNVLDKMMDQDKEATEQSDAVRKEFEAYTPVNTASASRTFSPIGPSSGPSFVPFGGSLPIDVANLPHDPLMPELEDIAKIQSTGIFWNAYNDHDFETFNTPYVGQSVGVDADFNNMEPSTVISQALDDESWVESMQEEPLQFKIQKVWTLVALPSGKKAIGTKWMYRNKKDERGIVIRNKARMVAQGGQIAGSSLVKQKEDGIFISQDKYVGEILKKFSIFSIRTASTPMETHKALKKDEDGEDVDVHLYRSMVGSLMYLTSSRPDIMCQLGQEIHNMRLSISWFKALTKDEDGEDVDVHLYRCQLGQEIHNRRLSISWQCKKQIVVANSTTEAEYITNIYVDNESVICVIKNPVYYSKTKHIEIRHHFIRDSYEKRLIEMVKIHTDHNVADLLTKAFDVSRFNFLVVSIGKRGRDTKIPQSGGPPIKVGDEAVHKELGDRMEMAAITASSLEVEQGSDAQTRFEVASKSPMTHLSQELTHLEVGRTKFTHSFSNHMANLEFCNKHNMVAYLQKSEGSEGFHQIIDFLNASHIQYALTENPTIYVSFIKQFWRTATARTSANGEVELTATIDGQVKTITEASLRRHLKLEDNGGVTTLPNSEIFEQLALMGYVTDSDKLTFQKGHFSPQWRFLIHTILHCLSPKKTAWEQFSSNIATAIICLATNRTYNFSKLIFDAMIKNLENPHKFLMYPRFLQICFN
ncbi:ribonuclease H-like domain-containing protein [Tanacetum coccineum]